MKRFPSSSTGANPLMQCDDPIAVQKVILLLGLDGEMVERIHQQCRNYRLDFCSLVRAATAKTLAEIDKKSGDTYTSTVNISQSLNQSSVIAGKASNVSNRCSDRRRKEEA